MITFKINVLIVDYGKEFFLLLQPILILFTIYRI